MVGKMAPSNLKPQTSNLRTFKTKQPLVPGYAFIHRRRVLSVFLGKGRGRAEEDGRVDGVLSHRFDTTGTFCVYGRTRHKRTT